MHHNVFNNTVDETLQYKCNIILIEKLNGLMTFCNMYFQIYSNMPDLEKWHGKPAEPI